MTHVNAAGRFESCCEDIDCTLPLPHSHRRPNAGEPLTPAPRSIAATSEELVRIIREGLDVRGSDISSEWKWERARNIAMAVMGSFDLSLPVIR